MTTYKIIYFYSKFFYQPYIIMCFLITCSICNKLTWKGCGKHVKELFKDVDKKKI